MAQDILDLAQSDQIRLTTTEGDALRSRLLDLGIHLQDDVRRIVTAVMASDRGVTLDEFVRLCINATVHRVGHEAGRLALWISCNLDSACQLQLGHDGDCDTEIPF